MAPQSEDNEKKPLIENEEKTAADDDIGYRKLKKLDIKTSWRNWLIGPVVFTYMFGMLFSFYLLIEYTNQYCQEDEMKKANLSKSVNASNDVCNVNLSDPHYQAETRATSRASTWNVYYTLASGIPAIISNIVLGSYTDAFGRKYLLAVGIIGTFLRLTIVTVVIYFKADLIYFLIACFIEGCTGQYATTLQVSLAYVADITEPGKWRIFGIIFIEFVIGVGLSSATLSSGYMESAYGYMYSMAFAAGILVVCLIFMLIMLPETLSKEHRHKDKSFISIMKIFFKLFFENDADNRRWKYQLVFVVHVLCNLSYLPRIVTETLYQQASPFCWTTTQVGTYAAIRTVAMMFIGLGSVALLQRWFNEVTLCMIGVISYGAAFTWTAFASNDLTLYLIIAVGCFGALSTTMQRSILSHLTPAEKQGAVFTAVGVIEIITTIVSNVSTGAIYSATVSFFRGFAFLILGGLDGICLILLIILKVGWQIEKRRNRFKFNGKTTEVFVHEEDKT